MNNRYSMFAPVLILAALVAAFLTADKLWLHWYASDTSGTTAKRTIQTPPAVGSVPSRSTTEQPLPGDSPTPSAQSRDAFAALWLTSQQTIYRVRYETSSDTGEKGDSYVVFNRPPSARVDTISAGATEPSSQIIVGADGTTFACSFDGGERNCGKIPSFDAPLPLAAGPMVFPGGGSFGSLSVAELDSKTIAGAAARCFRVVPAETPNAADYCFNAENVPVYGSGTFGVIQAAELSTPSEADFAAPTP